MLWEGLKCKQGLNPNYNVVFIVRRIILAALIVFPFIIRSSLPIHFQCICIEYLSLLYADFILATFPFFTKKVNFIEAFNEFTVLAIAVQLKTMLNFRDYDSLFNQGLFVNYTLLSMFLLNVLYVSGDIIGGWYR